MPEDRSLDEFAGDADGEPSDGGTEREADADAAESIDADPATSTATWTTDGGACDRCGESVARRWLDDGALVCTACKEW
ncbi:hypothetical protein DJ82_14030 [Halorubrum sp. Ib24]|uniref:DUF7573 domain-containing protein n=1 Tax=unclassified Halorubrum TaxID=2642239 RepID=UPI000B98E7F5|nr:MULTISPECIES: hypothetical protein [unclassified Halorubrum]OYR38049.1 hypothetical protein DJ82_14030 [Halorubrum sp. Ib24]OYR42034.1 hypothetical protein DJ81_11680 [Halorubrum sp. Hd13]OYR44873.1 hypothetical protein DJ75_08605 [Halorubrum sp. Eb13]OYR48541.1 hypothetical protein DJ73_19215 [Halorubrum sp. Ea1]OYR51269.1 hypothetical protein DJ74_04345 [Halorubrum sp. Ea8]